MDLLRHLRENLKEVKDPDLQCIVLPHMSAHVDNILFEQEDREEDLMHADTSVARRTSFFIPHATEVLQSATDNQGRSSSSSPVEDVVLELGPRGTELGTLDDLIVETTLRRDLSELFGKKSLFNQLLDLRTVCKDLCVSCDGVETLRGRLDEISRCRDLQHEVLREARTSGRVRAAQVLWFCGVVCGTFVAHVSGGGVPLLVGGYVLWGALGAHVRQRAGRG